MSRPRLHALARACGILDAYRANDGSRCSVSDRTREALVAAMGIDASSEHVATEALREEQERRQAMCLEAVAAVRSERHWELRARPPRRWRGRVATWSLTIDAEDGEGTHAEGSARVSPRRAPLIPGRPLAPGIYEARLRLDCDGESVTSTQWIFAAPPACVDVQRQLGQSRGFGLWAHVYALSRVDDVGIGDLGHLGELVDMAASEGAAFVATQPFHALSDTSGDPSPYSPTSRLFRNPIYLDIEAVPEFRESETAKLALEGFEASGKLDVLRTASRIDYEAVVNVKRFILEHLHRDFRATQATQGTRRGRAYRDYVDREGTALQAYGAFCALADRFSGTFGQGTDWRSWPTRFRDPENAAVRDFVREQAPDVEFHCWLQFEMDRQLAEAGARAKELLPLGLMGDLALGSVRGSADSWMHRGLFVDGVNLGAPPDAFADGQDWNLPPLHPMRSRADGYAYWRRVLRNAFDSMGALRIDHVMGLFRQFWIPAGRPPSEGGYVQLPSGELLALLALESHRARAVVVGEDLGTRPAALSPRLARAGILSTRVLPFERSRTGFRSARRYSRRAYVTAHTHDLPPLRGWLAGRDIELRHEAGEFQELGAFEAARLGRCREVAALRRRLSREGFLPSASGPNLDGDLTRAVTAFLASTPAPLLALSVDDLVGEQDPLNLPAVSSQRYSNWARRMSTGIDQVNDHALARLVLSSVPKDRRIEPCIGDE